ncbi:MAG: bifunctional heptose 7-phosphate kinase/heptose 1-phosphate adenyltransferase [Candidatus Melainabacteria bacterium]
MSPDPSPLLNADRLRALLGRFREARVLVVGDIVIDEMIYGHTARLSREAPVVILRHDHTDIILGGGGNAAHNVAKLAGCSAAGGRLMPVLGLSGADYYCGLLLEALERDGIDPSGLIQDVSRPTSTKTRVSGIANHSVTQQIVRIDRESAAPVSAEIEEKLLAELDRRARDCQAILLSDYGLGVVTPRVREHCRQLARKHHILVTVDSQGDLSCFQEAALITPNQPEAEANVGYSIDAPDALMKAGKTLLDASNARAILITRGASGMSLFERVGDRDLQVSHIPVFNKSDVFDVTGAGDTVIATMTVAMAVGATALEGAILGNLAASIVVRQFGAATTYPEELTTALEQLLKKDAGLLNVAPQPV